MLKFNNTLEIVLFIIMVGLFIAPLQVNSNYSLIFENVIGKVLIAIIILSIFTLNPLLGVFSILVTFKLFNLYNNNSGMIEQYKSNVSINDNSILKKYNIFPVTLEESTVGSIKDFNYNKVTDKSNYKSNKCITHNAKSL